MRPSDIAKVKKGYDITAPKFTKAASDKSIYEFSTKTVLDWWKKQQTPAPVAPPTGGSPGTGTGGTGGTGSSGTGGTGGPGTGAGSKPNEGIPEGTDPGTPAPPKPPGYTQGKPNPESGPSSAAVKPPSAKQIADALKAAGHPEWKPPAYALNTQADLAAWIARAKANTAAAKSNAGTKAGAIGGTNAGAPKPPPPKPKPIPHGLLK